MSESKPPHDLKELLERVCEAPAADGSVSLESILNVVGRRSFGPLLLLAGLVMVLPVIGDIPGVPVLMGLLVLLVAAQLLFRRKHIWLPRWLLKRSVTVEKLNKGVGWLQSPARFIDRFLRPRLTRLTSAAGQYVIAALCCVIALLTPVMEIVPLSANVAGAALTAFGLSLMAHDGLLALLASAFATATLALLGFNLI